MLERHALLLTREGSHEVKQEATFFRNVLLLNIAGDTAVIMPFSFTVILLRLYVVSLSFHLQYQNYGKPRYMCEVHLRYMSKDI